MRSSTTDVLGKLLAVSAQSRWASSLMANASSQSSSSVAVPNPSQPSDLVTARPWDTIALGPYNPHRPTAGRTEQGSLWRPTSNALATQGGVATSIARPRPSASTALKKIISGTDVALVEESVGSQWTGGLVGSLETVNQLSPHRNRCRKDVELAVMTSFQDATGDNASGQRWKKKLWVAAIGDSNMVRQRSARAAVAGSKDLSLHLKDLEDSAIMLGRGAGERATRAEATPGTYQRATRLVANEQTPKLALLRANALLWWQLTSAASQAEGGRTAGAGSIDGTHSPPHQTNKGVGSKWGVPRAVSPLLRDTSASLLQRQDFFLHQLYVKHAILFDLSTTAVGPSSSVPSVRSSMFDRISLGNLSTYLRLFRLVNLSLDLKGLGLPPAEIVGSGSHTQLHHQEDARDRHPSWMVGLYGEEALRRGFLSAELELEAVAAKARSAKTTGDGSSTGRRTAHTAAEHIADIVVSMSISGTPLTQRILEEGRLYLPALTEAIAVGGQSLSNHMSTVSLDMADPSLTRTIAAESALTAISDVRKAVMDHLLQ